MNNDGIEGGPASRALDAILAQLGSYTQLTYLQLQQLSIPSHMASLSRQLQRLQELQLADMKAAQPQPATAAGVDPRGGVHSHGNVHEDSVWGPLFRVVPLLAPLRKLIVDRLLPAVHDRDVSALGGASQLTCLRIAACGISEAAAAQLRAAFAHLPEGVLQTE